MFGDLPKSLIIVCDEKTEKYANFLRQLISLKDDKEDGIVGSKDGAVNVSVFLEKEYIANKPNMSVEQYVLFVGKNKTSDNERTSMKTIFNEHGMKYGWLGKRGMLIVEDTPLSAEEYGSFFEFATKNQYELEGMLRKHIDRSSEEESSKKGRIANNAVNGVAATAFTVGRLTFQPLMSVVGGVALMGSAVTEELKKAKTRNLVKDQQYRVLISVFYIRALSAFLEE